MRKTMLVLVCDALVACGTESIAMMIDDAGHALVDGAQLLDANDAAAAQDPRVVDVPCDGTGTRSVIEASHAVTATTTYYAQLDDVTISTASANITAAICDRTVVNSDPDAPSACPTGANCNDTHPTRLACTTVPVEFDNGHARVVCGSSVRSDSDGAGPAVAQESGFKYTTAHFVIR